MARTSGPITPLPEDEKVSERNLAWLNDVLSLLQFRVYEETLTAAAVAGGANSRQTFAVSGLTTKDIVIVNPPEMTPGMQVTNARVDSTNTLQLMFHNDTGGNIDPSGAYLILAYRRR
jgi:hypothetical protein